MGSIRRGGWLIASLLSVTTLYAAAGADTRLVDAAKKADKTAIRELLRQRINVNTPEADGTTALHWAVEADDVETTELLIRAGADIKAVNRYGATPLSRACLNGNAAIVEMLLKAGADPNSVLAGGETVLMTAARTGKVDAMKALLAHVADVNTKESSRGQTALMWAAAEGNAAAVKALIERGADIHVRSTGGFTAFLFAARQGKIDAARALIEAGASVNETLRVNAPVPTGNANKPEESAAGSKGGNADGPEEAIGFKGVRANGAQDSAAGSSALVLAVANAHYEFAAFLLEKGADPNAGVQGWTALHQVSVSRKPGNGDNLPPPEGSGNVNSLEIVRRLVAAGADVNARMKARFPDRTMTSLETRGATPFLMAARSADAELMRLLVQLGADPLLPNQDNTTPLLAAAGVGTRAPGEDAGSESEAFEAVKLALELGGNVNDVDKNGETAMHGAAYKHLTSLIPFLIEKGARMEVWNQKNKYGWTPLKIAEGVQRGQNIRSSPEVAAVLRQILGAATAASIR